MKTNFHDMPIITLELRGLGQKLAAAIRMNGEEMAAEVERGVEQAAAQIDVAAMARNAALPAIEKAIQSTVDSYFAYGEGRQIIRRLVGDALAKDDED